MCKEAEWGDAGSIVDWSWRGRWKFRQVKGADNYCGLYYSLTVCIFRQRISYRHLDGFHLHTFNFSQISCKGADLILGSMKYNTDYWYAVFAAGNSQSCDDHVGTQVELFVHNGNRFRVTYNTADTKCFLDPSIIHDNYRSITRRINFHVQGSWMRRCR